MRIALVHNLPSGGAKRQTYEQVRELACRGYEIVEFAPTTADLAYCSFAPFVKEQRIFGVNPVGQMGWRLPMITPYVHAAQGIMTLRRLERLSQVIAREVDAGKFELVFVKDCHLAMNPYVLRYLNTPTIFECQHGLRHRVERRKANVPTDHRSPLLEQLKAVYYSPARRAFDGKMYADETSNVRSASLVLTNSRFAQELVSEYYAVESHVVYPGISTEVFQPLPVMKMDYILCVGALIFTKGYRFLVSALSRIDPIRRPKLFVAANIMDAAERSLVEEMATNAGVELHIEGINDDARLVEVYSQARAFVYAPIQEALGLAPLESMACGTPVVAVAEGGVRETVVDGVTGWLVERDARAFAEKLETLLCDDKTRLRMGQAGIEYVRNTWNWRLSIDKLEQEFESAAL